MPPTKASPGFGLSRQCKVALKHSLPAGRARVAWQPHARLIDDYTPRGYILRIMPTATPHARHESPDHNGAGSSLSRTAFSATIHCLTGCAIGEVLGMVLSTWWGWSNTGNVALSVSLAFVFGYSLTMLPLLRAGLTLRRSLALAFASDTLSIATMEVLDTFIIFLVPGAMNAGVGDPLFWGSLAGALFVAFWAAFPVNRALIARGKGHAVVHAYH
jgi:Domain of unknown function (DUF4396)